ncbi:VOC family protein [Devosia sp.]|uniref:VOC family protein n=1 Tax=Devosia sp. TaxID=1871048 RepID=UPI003A946044
MKIAFDHVNIGATDLAATRDFLVRLLGVTDGHRPAFNDPGHWLYIDEQPVIHLSLRGDAPSRGGVIDHVAFAGFDFDETKARLEREGIVYHATGIPGGPRQLFVTGPDGLKVELQCRPV